MTTFEIDAEGDLVIDDVRQIGLLTGTPQVEQDIRLLILTVRGDDPPSPFFGVNWPLIIRSDYDPGLIESEIRKGLEQYDFVEEVNYVNIGEIVDRNLSVEVGVTLITGEGVGITIGIT